VHTQKKKGIATPQSHPRKRRDFGLLPCAGCHEIYAAGWFEIRGKYADGAPKHHSYCRDCRHAMVAQRWAKRRGAGVPRWGDYKAVRHLLKAQGYRCVYCGCGLGRKVDSGKVNYHLDHINPISNGGIHELSNLQVLCASCNLKKGAKILGRLVV
jgi:5-methylcytosine-specific restriction endonuclease McrA